MRLKLKHDVSFAVYIKESKWNGKRQKMITRGSRTITVYDSSLRQLYGIIKAALSKAARG